MRADRSCWKYSLQFFTFLFVRFEVNGLCLIGFGLWFLIDPAKNYLLDLVDFSEDEPLFRFATYTLLAAGATALLVAAVGCFGTIKTGRFMIGSFMLLMLALLLASIAVIVLPILFKQKFENHRMPIYLANISQNRYYRDKWTTPLMDSIQFYVSPSFLLPLAPTGLQQQCCGGKNGARDYENSFWYLTNTERGTRSFVPPSCCRQSQNGRAWAPVPIDPMCITYPYYSKAFNDSVNYRGCHDKLEDTMDDLLLMFVLLGAISSGVILFGLLISACFCRRLRYYEYVPR
ncbi:hypothetical protein M3Y99_01549000 [Aphelenchoides fujianensis]|nr:hypothetical protein M3Y99_01549000 [Aphelenchoides fujianensis]